MRDSRERRERGGEFHKKPAIQEQLKKCQGLAGRKGVPKEPVRKEQKEAFSSKGCRGELVFTQGQITGKSVGSGTKARGREASETFTKKSLSQGMAGKCKSGVKNVEGWMVT